MRPPRGTDLTDLTVAPTTSILEVMKTIDRSGLEVALVCDANNKLLAVVTDGDIRRALIRGIE
jgi:CBS domain-containing protein